MAIKRYYHGGTYQPGGITYAAWLTTQLERAQTYGNVIYQVDVDTTDPTTGWDDDGSGTVTFQASKSLSSKLKPFLWSHGEDKQGRTGQWKSTPPDKKSNSAADPDSGAGMSEAMGRLGKAADAARGQGGPAKTKEQSASLKKLWGDWFANEDFDVDSLDSGGGPDPTSAAEASKPQSPSKITPNQPKPGKGSAPLVGSMPTESNALAALTRAAEKLEKAADKLLGLEKKQSDKADAPKEKKDDGTGGIAGILQHLFGQHLRAMGSDLSSVIEGQLRGRLGGAIGRPLGQLARTFIGRTTEQAVGQGREWFGRLTGQTPVSADSGGKSGPPPMPPVPTSGGGAAKTAEGAGAGEAAAVGRVGAAGAGAGEAAAGAAGAGAAAGGAEAAAGGAAAAGAGAAEGAGAAGLAALASNPVTIAVAAVAVAMVGLGVAAKKSHDAIVDAAKAQDLANRKLAEFSAGMAAVEVDARIREVFRQQEIGDRTADSAGFLSQSNQKYEDQLKEMTVLLTNIKNGVLGFGMDFINGVLKPLDDIAKGINKLVGNKGEIKPEGFQGLLDEYRQHEADARRRGDEWFNARDYSRQRYDERP